MPWGLHKHFREVDTETVYWAGVHWARLAGCHLLITATLQVGSGVTFISWVRKQVHKGPTLYVPRVMKGININ